jgi:hypothetical protein
MKYKICKTLIEMAPFLTVRNLFGPMTKQLEIHGYLFAELADSRILSFGQTFGLPDQMCQACLPEIRPFLIGTVIVTDQNAFPILYQCQEAR